MCWKQLHLLALCFLFTHHVLTLRDVQTCCCLVFGGWNQLIRILKLIEVDGAIYMTLLFHPDAVIEIIFIDNSIFDAKAIFRKTVLNNCVM
jgi:hypothetical protein